MIAGLLVDIDGTIVDGGVPVPGASEAIAAVRERGLPLLFATNTSRTSRAQVARTLATAGLDIAPKEILSASWAAAERLMEDGVRRVHPLLTPAALADFAAFEIGGEAEAVVVGDMGELFTFDVLNHAFQVLRRGAKLIACQKNRFWKSERGVRLDAGAFVVALEYAAGVTAEVVGKPEPAFFHVAAKILGKPVEHLAIVGDGLLNDVAGGKAAGLTTILVRTGLFDDSALRASAVRDRPDHLLDSIADLPRLLATM